MTKTLKILRPHFQRSALYQFVEHPLSLPRARRKRGAEVVCTIWTATRANTVQEANDIEENWNKTNVKKEKKKKRRVNESTVWKLEIVNVFHKAAQTWANHSPHLVPSLRIAGVTLPLLHTTSLLSTGKTSLNYSRYHQHYCHFYKKYSK
jgi:hypothetical protein